MCVCLLITYSIEIGKNSVKLAIKQDVANLHLKRAGYMHFKSTLEAQILRNEYVMPSIESLRKLDLENSYPYFPMPALCMCLSVDVCIF